MADVDTFRVVEVVRGVFPLPIRIEQQRYPTFLLAQAAVTAWEADQVRRGLRTPLGRVLLFRVIEMYVNNEWCEVVD